MILRAYGVLPVTDTARSPARLMLGPKRCRLAVLPAVMCSRQRALNGRLNSD